MDGLGGRRRDGMPHPLRGVATTRRAAVWRDSAGAKLVATLPPAMGEVHACRYRRAVVGRDFAAVSDNEKRYRDSTGVEKAGAIGNAVHDRGVGRRAPIEMVPSSAICPMECFSSLDRSRLATLARTPVVGKLRDRVGHGGRGL